MDTNELLARRHGPSQRMVIPVDADTTRRLRAVILNVSEPLPWWRRGAQVVEAMIFYLTSELTYDNK